MKIATTTTTQTTATVGDPEKGGAVRITFEFETKDDAEPTLPETVQVQVFTEDCGDVEVMKFEIEPVQLERAASVLRRARSSKFGDDRELCLEHGYYRMERPHYDCPVCGRNAKVAAEQPKPEAVPSEGVYVPKPDDGPGIGF